MLPFLFLIGVVASSAVSVTNGSAISDDGSITCVDLSLDPLHPKPTQPYSVMTIGTDNVVTIDYGFPQVNTAFHVHFFAIKASPRILMSTYTAFHRRADFRQPMNLNISLSFRRVFRNTASTTNGSVYSYLQIGFVRPDWTTASFTVDLSILNQTPVLTPVLKNMTVGSHLYVKTSNHLFSYASISLNFSGVVDLDPFIQEALISGFIAPVDRMNDTKMMFRIYNGVSTITANLVMNYANVQYQQPVTVGDLTFVGEQLIINNSSLDYCNFTGPTQPTLTTQMQLGYLYPSPVTAAMKCRISCLIGYLNSTYYTPVGSYGFPIEISDEYELLATLDFTHSSQIYPNGSIDATPIRAAACLVLYTRTDYNSTTTTYTNAASATPTKEIFVCPFWTAAYSLQGIFVRNTSYTNSRTGETATFMQYEGTNSNGTVSWPAYYFYAASPTTNVTDFDIYSFIRLLYTSSPDLFVLEQLISGVSVNIFIYSGYAQFSSPAISIFPAGLRQYSPQDQCYVLSTFISGCDPNSPLFKIASWIISTPNLVLMARFREVLAFIDDFTYFTYHQDLRGPRFRAFCMLMWNLTNIKWIPVELQSSYSQLTQTFTNKIENKANGNVPREWQRLSESIYFLSNTSDYWTGSLPISIFLFALLYYLRILFVKYRWVRRLLIGFKWKVFLCEPVIIQNIQYFTFRSGQQFMDLSLSSSSLAFGYTNLILSYLSLFAALMAAIGQFILLLKLTHFEVEIIWDNLKPCYRSSFYTMVVLSTRLVTGLAHSLLYKQRVTQMALLAATQVTILLASVHFSNIFRSKFVFCFFVQEYVLRSAVYFLLCFQVAFGSQSILIEGSLDNVAMNLIVCITATCLGQILSSYLARQKASCQPSSTRKGGGKKHILTHFTCKQRPFRVKREYPRFNQQAPLMVKMLFSKKYRHEQLELRIKKAQSQ